MKYHSQTNYSAGLKKNKLLTCNYNSTFCVTIQEDIVGASAHPRIWRVHNSLQPSSTFAKGLIGRLVLYIIFLRLTRLNFYIVGLSGNVFCSSGSALLGLLFRAALNGGSRWKVSREFKLCSPPVHTFRKLDLIYQSTCCSLIRGGCEH